MKWFLLAILLFASICSRGNNVRIVGTVKTPASGMSGNIVSIQFTLEWENSWSDDYNHDGVYVALRYKYLKQNPIVWYPVYLQSAGHTADNNFECTIAPAQVGGNTVGSGVFITPATRRSGIARTNVELKWDLSTTNSNGAGRLVPTNLVVGDVILACTGIEVVYIPRGAFAVGDSVNLQGGKTSSPGALHHRDCYIPESLDLVDTTYWLETNPDGLATNPASLAANHINDLTNGTSNAWVSNSWAGIADDIKFWTIDFGRLADGTELPLSKSRRTVRYIGIESIPGRVPKKWTLMGAQEDRQGGWVEIYTGTSSDWGTSLERVYPPKTAIRLNSIGDYRYYRIIVKKEDMSSGVTPVIKSVSMTDRDLSESYDYTFIVDSTQIPLGGVRGLSASDGEVWTAGTLGVSYPTGYNAFYVMKYEMSQDQYCGFLQMISPSDQQSRTIGAALKTVEPEQYVFGPSRTVASWRNGIVVTKRTATGDTVSFGCNLDPGTPVSLDGDGMPIACNYLTVNDMLKYASWIGLRPLTELEYERLCRPPYPYVPEPRECAWNDLATTLPGDLQEGGKSNETVSSGNANYGNRLPGPVRVGVFAGSGTQKGSGSGFWGVQDLSGNLSEIYYNLSATGRKYNASSHGLGTLSVPSGWQSDPLAFGLRGGSFRSVAYDISSSNRSLAVRRITNADFRDSTVTFRLGYSCPEGPRLPSVLTLEDGRTSAGGSVSDTICDGVDYTLLGNEPSGRYAVNYLWYKSENLGKTWELMRGETGKDLVLKNLYNRGMPDKQYHEYWVRRKVIRDNSEGVSSPVKLLVINPAYTVSRLRDTLDGYGEAAGIRVTTKYDTEFTWHYLATGKELVAVTESGQSSYYLPRRKDLASEDTTRQMHGRKILLVTMNIHNACERSEMIEVDVINTLDKDLMKVKNYGGYRAWADGTYAPSAEAYRRPGGGYEYRGDIGSGVYRIDPDGRDGPIEPFDVYCDMVTEGGGWALCMTVTNLNGQYVGWWGNDASFGGRAASGDYFTNTTCLGDYLHPDVKVNSKSPVFLYNSFTEMMIQENYAGQTGNKGYRLSSKGTMQSRFQRANRTGYSSDVSAILFTNGKLNTFQTATLMWNYDLSNDGARLASTGVSSESTCGISSRVDGSTSYSWKGNITRFDSGRHYNTNGGSVADHTAWIWIR